MNIAMNDDSVHNEKDKNVSDEENDYGTFYAVDVINYDCLSTLGHNVTNLLNEDSDTISQYEEDLLYCRYYKKVMDQKQTRAR